MMTGRAAVATAGAAAVAVVALGVAAPPVVGFLLAEAPQVYGAVVAWLTPPYLYLIINGIIISIAASSRFQKHSAEQAEAKLEAARYDVPAGYVVAAKEEEGDVPQYDVPAGYIVAAKEEEGDVPRYDVPAVYLMGKEEEVEKEGYDVTAANGAVEEDKETQPEYGVLALYDGEENKRDEGDGEEEFVIARSSWTPKSRGESREMPTEYSTIAREKPLVSVRFGHRRIAKPSPDGKTLRVAAAGRMKRNDTLESTWRTITDGRAVPLTRHLRKSDTWATRDEPQPAVPAAEALMQKSETFSEGGRPSPGSGGGKLRREPSLGQDELNRRVEAFINKFNEEMRLQRQESFKHYLDMINRGSH